MNQPKEIITTEEGYGRFTKKEMEIIKATFGGNDLLLRLLRKVFLPLADISAPVGQITDIYMAIATDDKDDATIARNVKARNDVMMHVESQLMQLEILSKSREESALEMKDRLARDSSK